MTRCNVAARLQQAAQPGEILLGQSTLRLARAAVEAEPIEAADVEGQARAGARVAARRGLHRCPGTALRLGPRRTRAESSATLAEAWERARSAPACELVTVVGAAGVGKSRLVAEFLAGVEATVVRGRCLSYGEGITYWPVVEVLKQLEAAAGAGRARSRCR